MDTLHLGVEIRDFDLERLGFSLSVLDERKKQASEGYLRMTLAELSIFLNALRAAGENIDLSTVDSQLTKKRPTISVPSASD